MLADKYNEPGHFTALIGYEWTAIGGYNLHRNVIFRGDATAANRTMPFSQFDSKNPEMLWKHLAELENTTGAQLLAIPHNGNLSNGRMFTVETFDGEPLTKELAAMRIKYEPLVEVTQIRLLTAGGFLLQARLAVGAHDDEMFSYFPMAFYQFTCSPLVVENDAEIAASCNFRVNG